MYVPIAALVLAAGGMIACTVNSTTNTPPVGDDAGDDSATTTPGPDSGTSPDSAATTDDAGDAGEDAAAPEAFVRLAHWSPDGPAVDVCFNPAGSSFNDQTPALAQVVTNTTDDAGTDAATLSLVDGGDGGAYGLTFPQVSTYLIIPPGTYDMRIVAAGSTDCSTGLVADLTGVTLAMNTYTTVAAVGDVSPASGDQALKLVSFADDVTAPSAQISVRFINASPAADLAQADLGTGSIVGNGGAFAALFTGVTFGTASAAAATDAGPVDANGYLANQPFAGATLSAHATGSAQDTTIAQDDVAVDGGQAATVVLINGSSNPTASTAAKLLLCLDQDDSTNAALLATCSVISTD
jgi:hypothetical protein